MKKKNFINVLLTAAMMVGLSLSGVACSDSNKDENGSGDINGDEPQIENEQEELGWHLATKVQPLPAGWIRPSSQPLVRPLKVIPTPVWCQPTMLTRQPPALPSWLATPQASPR